MKKGWKPDKPIKFQRLCERYAVKLTGEVVFNENISIPVSIGEVSKTGFMLKTNGNIPQGFVNIRIKSPEGIWMEMSAQRVWEKGAGEQGFRIVNPCDEWDAYIEQLESTQDPLKIAA